MSELTFIDGIHQPLPEPGELVQISETGDAGEPWQVLGIDEASHEVLVAQPDHPDVVRVVPLEQVRARHPREQGFRADLADELSAWQDAVREAELPQLLNQMQAYAPGASAEHLNNLAGTFLRAVNLMNPTAQPEVLMGMIGPHFGPMGLLAQLLMHEVEDPEKLGQHHAVARDVFDRYRHSQQEAERVRATHLLEQLNHEHRQKITTWERQKEDEVRGQLQ